MSKTKFSKSEAISFLKNTPKLVYVDGCPYEWSVSEKIEFLRKSSNDAYEMEYNNTTKSYSITQAVGYAGHPYSIEEMIDFIEENPNQIIFTLMDDAADATDAEKIEFVKTSGIEKFYMRYSPVHNHYRV